MKYIVVLLCCFGTVCAQDASWVLKKSQVGFEGIGTIACPDAFNCFAFADDGGTTTIYKSIDQGNTWEQHYFIDRIANSNDSLYNLFQGLVLDSMYLYMTSLDRVALEKSTDGGKTFERVVFGEISADATAYFYGINMYNRNIGAGVTKDHLIVTRDNWESYEAIDLEEFERAGDPVFFIDSVTVALLKTFRNSHEFVSYNILTGEWQQYSVGEETPTGRRPKVIAEIDFIDENLAYAAGFQLTGENQKSTDVIWKTTDKGQTWELVLNQLYDDFPFGPTSISFKDARHGMAASNPRKIIETTDGGETWQYIDVPDGNGTSSPPEVAWAGDYALIAGFGEGGIYRREIVTDVHMHEPSSEQQISIQQGPEGLTVTIENSASHIEYSLQLVDLYGKSIINQKLHTRNGHSIVIPEFNTLNSGTYLYLISSIEATLKSGVLQITR